MRHPQGVATATAERGPKADEAAIQDRIESYGAGLADEPEPLYIHGE